MRELLAPYAAEVERYAADPPDVVDQGILLWLVLHHAIAQFEGRHPEWLFARLEDLSRHPDEGFRRIFAHLGLDYTDRVAGFVRETTAATNPAEASRLDSVRRDSAQHVNNWKRTLSAAEVERVRTRTEPLAARYYTDADW